ncbi:MAG: hypothetical protein HC822_08475 [Oscillochloris sp.]|nr:hypothetical protein [Oscillochloris sp.]
MTTSPMNGRVRFGLALGLLLGGMLLLPYIALPSEQFRWQLFSGTYGNGPELAINYDEGAPGSSFTITGIHFPSNESLLLLVNGVELGEVRSDDLGSFFLRIDSTSASDLGFYGIELKVDEDDHAPLDAAAAQTGFRLTADAPLRAAEAEDTVFALPDQIARQLVYLPMLFR